MRNLRPLLLLPLLLASSGCGLPSLPYRSAQAVVDPDGRRRAEDDRRADQEMRRREAQEYRAYMRCRDQGYSDC